MIVFRIEYEILESHEVNGVTVIDKAKFYWVGPVVSELSK